MKHISELLPHSPQRGLKLVLNEKFDCELCHDAGFVHPINNGKPDWGKVVSCVCRKDEIEKSRQESYLRLCHLPSYSESKTLGTFDTYGEQDLIDAKEAITAISEGTQDILWVTLGGKSDYGKSHLAIAACREWLNREKVARYANVPLLLHELQNGLELEGEYSYRSKLDFLCNVGLLALDDLGKGKMTEWRVEQIQMIIDYRYDNGRPLIVTTNRPIDDLFDFEGHPNETWRELADMTVSSRLQRESWCRVVIIETREHMMRL